MKCNKNTPRIILAIILVLVGIQFIGDRPETKKENPADLLKQAPVPGNVASILRHACYDCHSNETVYPWYASVAPVSWLINRDVKEGREKLNFSEWGLLTKAKKAKMLDKISEEAVEDNEMPMAIYVLLHPKAKLTDKDRKKLQAWLDAYGESLFSKSGG